MRKPACSLAKGQVNQMKSYMVIGLGRFGSSLARNLCQLGAEVLAMDVRSDLVQQLSNDVTHAVVGLSLIHI